VTLLIRALLHSSSFPVQGEYSPHDIINVAITTLNLKLIRKAVASVHFHDRFAGGDVRSSRIVLHSENNLHVVWLRHLVPTSVRVVVSGPYERVSSTSRVEVIPLEQ